MNGRFYVGEWLVEPEQSRLVRGSDTAKLDPKAVRVLAFLASHSNVIVTKEEIIGSVWEGTFVSDEVLTTAIWGLRKALGDDAKEPRYIQTIPRKGYRLIAPVEGATEEASGRWEPAPYPGLSPFSQRDAPYFFGREEEVEALWTRIHERNLLGLIGPSGAGKTSLLRAGLIPAAPEGWDVVLLQPRTEVFEKLSVLLGEGPSPDARALWVVDQFEELFTLHDEETQGRFAALLGRAAASGVHVLLSMRDDFLVRCHAHAALEPVFDKLTPVLPLEGAHLRRALVEPARASGYRFEDESLVAEILTEVSRERGALPLLSFAASRLWEKRDRDGRRLTREAYLAIGGVAGALAHHAEMTLSAIGLEREPMVREILRNLTTASGTRVPMNRHELMTVFPNREEAERTLGKLIDARLLTLAVREVEIVHESLLSAWPRLVRWQAQDAEGAVLRDQLRQAARGWQERGRPDDLLWTGTSYRELALWRERYGRGLTATEEEFAEAAASLAGRRRRRRRTAVVAGFAVLLMVVGIMSSLWRRSVLEVSRREAAQILALGRLELQDNPTQALAHALGSLERADSEEARRFAVETLWHGAAAIVLEGGVNNIDFSPDGQWIATLSMVSGVRLWSRHGGPPQTLGETNEVSSVTFSPGSEFLVAGGKAARFWSLSDRSLIRGVALEGNTSFRRRGSHLFSFTELSGKTTELRDWSVPDKIPDVLASFDSSLFAIWDIDASGKWLVTARGNRVHLMPLVDTGPEPVRLLGEHSAKVVWISSHPTAPRVISSDETGAIRVWSVPAMSGQPERTFRAPAPAAQLDPTGSWMIVSHRGGRSTSNVAYLMDRNGPPDVSPIVLRNGNSNWVFDTAIDPQGRWLLSAHADFGILWPLPSKRSLVLAGQDPPFIAVAFTPDGSGLVSTSDDGTVRRWPLTSSKGARSRVLMEDRTALLGWWIDVDPQGRHVLVGSRFDPRAFLVPLETGAVREMPGLTERMGGPYALSPDGRLALAATIPPPLRIWDLASGEVRLFDIRVPGAESCAPDDFAAGLWEMEFLADGRLLTLGYQGIRIWDLERGTSRQILSCRPEDVQGLSLDRARRRAVVWYRNSMARSSTLGWLDVETGEFHEVVSHGKKVWAAALDSTGTIVVTGDADGVVRVGPITGEAPHLLYGHSLEVSSVAVSPDGRWIASGSQDGTIQLWPIPEGTPFHALPYEELLERLRALTNLRVVADDTSATGYGVAIGPFPGWMSAPIW